MILIVGGTGSLGTALARRLLADGTKVRVMTRAPERARELRKLGAELMQGDLLDSASVVRACAGMNAVVAAAHSLFGRGRTASVHVDGRGHRDLIDAARAAGVRHVVYTSVQDYGPAYRTVPFFRIKLEVEEYLRASGLAFTIVRPAAFMDVHAHLLIGAPILAQRRVLLFGRGDTPRNFVAACDVAALIALALRDESLRGETIAVGGPENLTNHQVVHIYERLSGRRARVVHVPLAVPRALSALMRSMHPGLSQVMQSAVLQEQTDQTFDARAFRDRFPLPLTCLRDWAADRVLRHRTPT